MAPYFIYLSALLTLTCVYNVITYVYDHGRPRVGAIIHILRACQLLPASHLVAVCVFFVFNM